MLKAFEKYSAPTDRKITLPPLQEDLMEQAFRKIVT